LVLNTPNKWQRCYLVLNRPTILFISSNCKNVSWLPFVVKFHDLVKNDVKDMKFNLVL